jgi:hypothetical protein
MGFYRGPNIVTDGLVYAMDAGSARSYDGTTTLNDLVSSNTGTLTNGVTYQSINGGVFDFDGTDDYIVISNANSPQFTANQAFTISYIVYLNRVTGTYMAPVMKGYFGSSYGHLIGASNLFLVYTDNDSSPELNLSGMLTNDANKWVSITQTYDGSRIYVYRNGVLAGQSGTGVSFTINTSPLYFGSNNSTGYYLDGKMANLKMYNKALSAAEVTQNFNAQKSRFGL